MLACLGPHRRAGSRPPPDGPSPPGPRRASAPIIYSQAAHELASRQSVRFAGTPRNVQDSNGLTRIMVMSDVVLPLAEIKKRLSEIIDGVEGRHDRVVLTRYGRPAAVIMSPDELESLEETLDLLSDPKAMRQIRKAEAAVAGGDVVTADELRGTYLKH